MPNLRQPKPAPEPTELPIAEQSVNGDQPAGIDPFSPEANRVTGLDAKFKRGPIPVKEGKPHKHEFFRIHPDPDFAHVYWLLTVDDGKDRQTYIILEHLRHLVARDVHPFKLVVGINRHDTVFVWPIRLYSDEADKQGPGKSWSDSAQEKCERAKSIWLRIEGNRSAGQYDHEDAEDPWPEPDWPDYTFADLVRKAFGEDRLVGSQDHPVFAKIRGRGVK
jgi:hypothetical protein